MSNQSTDDPSSRRQGDFYRVSDTEKESFRADGYVHLRGVLSEQETDQIGEVYERFLRREIDVPGKDFNDMTTGEHGTNPAAYAIANVMVPRRYLPEWQGNIFERRAATIAEQLFGEGMAIDFDQLLAKQPLCSARKKRFSANVSEVSRIRTTTISRFSMPSMD